MNDHVLHLDTNDLLITTCGSELDRGRVEITDYFQPRFGRDRNEVNPDKPNFQHCQIPLTVPGEYYLKTTDGPTRLLVLSDDRTTWAEQVVRFVAANTTPGNLDEPENDKPAMWPNTDQRLWKRLFRGELEVDVQCGYSSRLVIGLLVRLGMSARPFWWNGCTEPYTGHIGVEVCHHRVGWVYYDTHFGLSFQNQLSGLEGALRLKDCHTITPHDPFQIMVDKGPWVSEHLQPGFQSLRTAVRLQHTEDRRMVAYRVTTQHPIFPPGIGQLDILEGTVGLEQFREFFYNQPSHS